MTSPSNQLQLRWLDGSFAICRMPAEREVPAWAQRGSCSFCSITRTDDELSIVVSQAQLPSILAAGIHSERDWAAMRIVGTLDFSEVGIIARLSDTLAASGISVFVISTFDTDYVLVRQYDRDRAEQALSNEFSFV